MFNAKYEGEKGDTPAAKDARNEAWTAAKPEYLLRACRTIRLLDASKKISISPSKAG